MMLNFFNDWLNNRKIKKMRITDKELLVEDARVEIRVGIKKIESNISRMIDKCAEAKSKGNDALAETYKINAARLMTFSEKLEKVGNYLDVLITMATTVDGYSRLGQVLEQAVGVFDFDTDFTSIGRSVRDMDNMIRGFESTLDSIINDVDSDGVNSDSKHLDENTKKHFDEIDKRVAAKIVPISTINPTQNLNEVDGVSASVSDPVGGVKGLQGILDEVNEEDN